MKDAGFLNLPAIEEAASRKSFHTLLK